MAAIHLNANILIKWPQNSPKKVQFQRQIHVIQSTCRTPPYLSNKHHKFNVILRIRQNVSYHRVIHLCIINNTFMYKNISDPCPFSSSICHITLYCWWKLYYTGLLWQLVSSGWKVHNTKQIHHNPTTRHINVFVFH